MAQQDPDACRVWQLLVKFFFSQTDTPLIFALLLAVGLGFVIGLALPRFTGRDRRHED